MYFSKFINQPFINSQTKFETNWIVYAYNVLREKENVKAHVNLLLIAKTR